MFVFEDLSKLDPGGVQTLLRATGKEQLALALKGASTSCARCSSRTCRNAPRRSCARTWRAWARSALKDVDQAQVAMVQVAKDLAAKGEIMLAGAGPEDELIY